MPSQYVDTFLKDGIVLFRSLAYFRDYYEKDEQVRGDRFDGTRIYKPENGLEINKAGETFTIPSCSFESDVRVDEIFVFCMSLVNERTLYTEFKTDVCVEIFDSEKFIWRIKTALKRRPTIKPKKPIYGPVQYYENNDPPIIDWAFPDRIVMRKQCNFEWQKEYRIAFSIRNALGFQQTTHKLVIGSEERTTLSSYPEHIIRIGSMEDIAVVHKIT